MLLPCCRAYACQCLSRATDRHLQAPAPKAVPLSTVCRNFLNWLGFALAASLSDPLSLPIPQAEGPCTYLRQCWLPNDLIDASSSGFRVAQRLFVRCTRISPSETVIGVHRAMQPAAPWARRPLSAAALAERRLQRRSAGAAAQPGRCSSPCAAGRTSRRCQRCASVHSALTTGVL